MGSDPDIPKEIMGSDPDIPKDEVALLPMAAIFSPLKSKSFRF